jgi:hypothetical protein
MDWVTGQKHWNLPILGWSHRSLNRSIVSVVELRRLSALGPLLPVHDRQLMGVLLTVSSATRWLLMTPSRPEQVQQSELL